MTRHKKHKLTLRSMYQWHRYVGISAAFFIIILAVTGIMLNHTSQLKLDTNHIESEWLLNYYGIKAPENINNYSLGKQWLSQWNEKLYLDTQYIGETGKKIVGAIHYKNMIVIAQSDSLLLYTPKGELIDIVSGKDGIPAGIEAIGHSDKGELAINAANGVFTTNQELLFWSKTHTTITVWADTSTLPQPVMKPILEHYRGKGLKIERVILDLHSGRLLGDWGIYFTDFIALLMIFLASSGMWIWVTRNIKKKKHHKN